VLRQENVRRRSPRIVCAGFSDPFGKPTQKPKDDPLKFGNPL
jgi:hypothetical protein